MENNYKIIIGLAGKIACGKETVGQYLEKKYDAKKIRFSDSLRQVLDILDLSNSRENMQKLSTLLRQNFDEKILARAILKAISRIKNKIVIIDGVRRLADITNFRELKNFFLIYIDASEDKRFERCVKRNENPGDKEMTRAEFDEKDKAEAEEQIELLREKSDFVLKNNGTLEQLYGGMENILKKIHENKN